MSNAIRVPVGDGTPEGINSAYVLPDHGAVIDPGPPSDDAWVDLQDGIETATLELDAIDHVFVTHWHMDHAGLACRLANHVDATVHVHQSDAPLIGAYAAARDRRLDRDEQTLERWGVPESIRTTVMGRDMPSPIPSSVPVTAHEDGDVVAGVEFIHTPGHTKGHTSFMADDELFLGDVLLPTYTPNVGGSDTRMDDPLAAYLSSVTRLETVSRRGNPGHGTELSLADASTEVRRHHRDRAAAAFRAIDTTNGEGSTPWDVAQRLFGEMEGIHAKFGAGEAAAHLQRLASMSVVERLEGIPVRFRPVVEEYPTDLTLTR